MQKTIRHGDYDYWESPHGTRHWKPTLEYLDRVVEEHRRRMVEKDARQQAWTDAKIKHEQENT